MDFDDMRPREGDDDPRLTDWVADDRAERREEVRQRDVMGKEDAGYLPRNEHPGSALH